MKGGEAMVNEYLLERLVNERISELLRCVELEARAALAASHAAARQLRKDEAVGTGGRNLMARRLRWRLL
jgi:hypothetical protein